LSGRPGRVGGKGRSGQGEGQSAGRPQPPLMISPVRARVALWSWGRIGDSEANSPIPSDRAAATGKGNGVGAGYGMVKGKFPEKKSRVPPHNPTRINHGA
jgi:hypothetical protein